MKIITWNVQWFCGLDGVIDIARVVKDAQDMADFDVICMQEVAVNYPRLDGDASHNQPEILKSLLPGFEVFLDRKSTRLNSSHHAISRMPSSA